jgi:hypothetical protein
LLQNDSLQLLGPLLLLLLLGGLRGDLLHSVGGVLFWTREPVQGAAAAEACTGDRLARESLKS